MRESFRSLAHAGLVFDAPLGEERAGEPAAAAFAAGRRRPYEDGYRGVLGFAWLELVPGP